MEQDSDRFVWVRFEDENRRSRIDLPIRPIAVRACSGKLACR
jgi:hypothetical protein